MNDDGPKVFPMTIYAREVEIHTAKCVLLRGTSLGRPRDDQKPYLNVNEVDLDG